MTPGEPKPARLVEIVDAALEAWAARWPLYVALAAASIAVEFGLDALFKFNELALVLIVAVIDGFPTGLVSIDVATRARGETVPLRTLLRAALIRWPVVTTVLAIVTIVQPFVQSAVFGNSDETLYGILILPGLALGGILALPSVIASIETGLPLVALPGFALLRSLLVAGGWPNVGRLTLGGAMLAVPSMIQLLLEHWFTIRGFGTGEGAFWANIPVDALSLAPFQAFFTYLYLDVIARETRR